MANLSETATYDVGVYQLETTDPVEGGDLGKSNAPLHNLANRTKWLKAAYDALATFVTTLAPLISPVFSGTPTAPTAPFDDSSLKLANTAFVKSVTGGILTKSVAGSSNVTLSAPESSYGTLLLTGAITANIAVIVPAVGKNWIVRNGTTGAFTVTVKTASGSGIAVTQGRIASLFCDGADVNRSTTDFANAALTGVPTSTTAAPGTNSTQVATCAFVQQELALAGGVTVSHAAAQDLGVASGGAGSQAAAIDHVHKKPTAADLAVVPLAGGVDMSGRLGLQNVSLKHIALGAVSGTVHIDMDLGGYFSATITGPTTFVYDNPPAADKWGGFDLELTNAGTNITWPASVKWPGGVPPGLTVAGVDCLSMPTRDHGTTFRGAIWAKDSR